MSKVEQINDVFTKDELTEIYKAIVSSNIPETPIDEFGTGIHPDLGRIQLGNLKLPDSINEKVKVICKEYSGLDLEIDHCLYAKYAKKYGEPNLPPHTDSDRSNLVFNYQLESNISWDLGVNTTKYTLADNSVLIFNNNEDIHWRTIREFNDAEYVTMLFWRLYDPNNRPDYTHIDRLLHDPFYAEANKYRNKLAEPLLND